MPLRARVEHRSQPKNTVNPHSGDQGAIIACSAAPVISTEDHLYDAHLSH
jgi:hypothetical protein